jgi:hypothetical protein
MILHFFVYLIDYFLIELDPIWYLYKFIYLSLIISINFSTPMIFVPIIFHLKSSLAKNYLMPHRVHMIFNFLLNFMLLFQ